MENLILTEKQARVLEILRATGEPMFAADIAAQDAELFTSAARSVTPVAEGLVKKGLVDKGEAERAVEGGSKTYKTYTVNEAGLNAEFDVK